MNSPEALLQFIESTLARGFGMTLALVWAEQSNQRAAVSGA